MQKTWTLALLFALLWSARADAGTISGEVTAKGRDLPGGAGGGAYDSKKYKFIEKMDYDEVTEFVVYIEAPYSADFAKFAKSQRVVVQENATFSPRVMPILVGTEVEWPNEDDIYHNVFSFSQTKQFDLGLYKDEIKKVVFDKPGRIDVFCSIHKNMSCIILVLENPWFAATDADRRYEIKDVPAGTYKLTAWHERMPPQTVDVTVPEEGSVTVDFDMGIKGLPTY